MNPKQNALGQVKNVIAVASGKGGVGKSTTAVNLARALIQMGKSVALCDADIYGPTVPMMTKVGIPKEMQGDLIVPPEVDGIKVISVSMFNTSGDAQILRGPMAANMVRQFLTQVAWGPLDYLLIDYPPGTGDIQLTISQVVPLTCAIIVTTPQDVALANARRAISMFDVLKVPVLGVIETMSYFVCDGCSKKHYIFRQGGGAAMADAGGVPLLAEIPLEPGVTLGSDEGSSIFATQPHSLAAQGYRQAAAKVEGEISILKAQAESGLTSFSLVWKGNP